MNSLVIQIYRRRFLEYFLLSIILITGFLVRLYKINNPLADWHSWRQADTASVTRTYSETGINLLFPRYHDISSIQSRIFNPQGYRFVEFPLFNILHAILIKNFPVFSLEVWGRLLSIICSAFSTLLLFLIGRRFLGKIGGLLTAFFYSFIPFNIYFTRVILPEPLSVMLGIAGLWLFIKYFDTSQNLFIYLSAVAFSLAILVKPFTIFYLIPVAGLILEKYRSFRGILNDPKSLTIFLSFIAILFVPFLLWRAWISRFPEGIPLFAWVFNGDHIRFRPSFWRWIFAERLGRLILGVWGLIPFCLGILKTNKRSRFILWFLLGMFLYVLIVASANVRHDYYQALIIPAVSLALASGSIALWSAPGLNKNLSRIILVFSVFLMILVGAVQIKDNFLIIHPEILEAGAEVDRLVPKNALVVAPYNGDTAFLYQTKRWGWPAIDDSIDNIITKGADYYVSVSPNDDDTKMIISRFQIIKSTDKYVIVDLHKPLINKKP